MNLSWLLSALLKTAWAWPWIFFLPSWKVIRALHQKSMPDKTNFYCQTQLPTQLITVHINISNKFGSRLTSRPLITSSYFNHIHPYIIGVPLFHLPNKCSVEIHRTNLCTRQPRFNVNMPGSVFLWCLLALSTDHHHRTILFSAPVSVQIIREPQNDPFFKF